jgi:hypothetical protein
MADSLLQSNQDLVEIAPLLYPDSLLSAGPAPTSPALIELLLQLHEITGKDRYKKAVGTLKSKYFSGNPDRLRLLGLSGGETGLDELLTEAQTAVTLDQSGSAVKGLSSYFDALLARICLNRCSPDSEFNPVGGIKADLGDPGLVFRGFELSHTLLTLDERLNESSKLDSLDLLIGQLLGFALQKPLGTTRFDPDQKQDRRFGARSSTIWTRELYYMMRLLAEFPRVSAR